MDHEGAILPEVAAVIGTSGVLRWEQARAELESSQGVPRSSRGAGVVSFSAGGELGRALGGRGEVSLTFPAIMSEALDALSGDRASVRELLFVNAAPIATGWRAGERVDLDDALTDGDHIDLVLAVGGG